MPTREEVNEQARAWIEAWNRRDLEAILAEYAEEVEFRSPTAVRVTGRAVVRGKDALRAYWRNALDQIASLRFELREATWDGEARALAIYYLSEVDGARKTVCETMWLDESGRVVRSEVFHGAPAE